MSRPAIYRALRIAALAPAAWIAPAAADELPVAAQVAPHMVAMTDAEMAEAHGGFDWGGMNITFGADVQTYLNGQLALQTVVNWTANGATTQTIVGSQLMLADVTAAGGAGGGIAVPANLSNSVVYLANAGQTALVQNTSGALQNVLVNAMANLNAVQQTNATVTLGNYAAFAATLCAGALNMGLGREIASFSH
ncbi:hypothetical protein F9288_13405 [Sphingomonas sp. CL5.1]|uniref:hypothetical protein n=1 Tax=Sphingomonas sp. CL5.1 TaxID=2653203 RepID=UPI001581A106|nr:hypothetical protein [Sphingomonas sp. CL5.1]QKS00504.1 hypothetical protein F9288_13405 [Sphingomonas sp. CL5.1]